MIIYYIYRAKWKLCKIERVYYNIITNVGQITRGGGCQYRPADRWVYIAVYRTPNIYYYLLLYYIYTHQSIFTSNANHKIRRRYIDG